ncbi:hypothetical protein ACTFIZ_011092 [Dictyostelium cf. discoideum]
MDKLRPTAKYNDPNYIKILKEKKKKKEIIYEMLNDPRFSTDRPVDIAKILDCSPQYVSKIKAKIENKTLGLKKRTLTDDEMNNLANTIRERQKKNNPMNKKAIKVEAAKILRERHVFPGNTKYALSLLKSITILFNLSLNTLNICKSNGSSGIDWESIKQHREANKDKQIIPLDQTSLFLPGCELPNNVCTLANNRQVGVHVTSEDSINKFKITDTKKSTRGRNPKVLNQVNLVQNFIQNVETMNLLQNSTVPGGIVQNVTNIQTQQIFLHLKSDFKVDLKRI